MLKRIISALLCGCLMTVTALTSSCQSANNDSDTPDNQSDDKVSALRQEFLAEADKVIVNEDSVTFTDASGDGSTEITISKNPEKVVNLYASFTTLWYEAGGTVIGCIGGDSSVALYNEYIGRDITQDEGMTIAATSSSGKKWDTETIISLDPDLIICSTAMSGYSTIQAPAEAADIPLIAVSYNDFADYLKWFKVFCNLTGHPELWESVALKTLDEVVNVLASCPTENNPTVFAMFSGADSLQANTSNTVVGQMITMMNATNITDSWGDTSGAERLDINLETVFASDPTLSSYSATPEPKPRCSRSRSFMARIRYGSRSPRSRRARSTTSKRRFSTTSRTAASPKHMKSSPIYSIRMLNTINRPFPTRYKSHHDASRSLKQRYTLNISAEEYLEQILNQPAKSRRAIYIHVPFCTKVCSFCPFSPPRPIAPARISPPLDCRNAEDTRLRVYESPDIGGQLRRRHADRAVARTARADTRGASSKLQHLPDAEISVETSATELTDDMLSALRRQGVNRLSVGVQTFDDDGRALLGRRGGGGLRLQPDRARARIRLCNRYTYSIYNYPGQTEARLLDDIRRIGSLGLAGISFYSLMLHERTPLYYRLGRPEREELENIDRQYVFFNLLLDQLEPYGYEPFELTKLIRNKLDKYEYMEVRHSHGSCIALGQGAGGNIDNYLYSNTLDYDQVSETCPISASGRIVSDEYRIIDSFIWELQKGSVDLGGYSKRLGLDLYSILQAELERFVDYGLIEYDDDKITLTRDGLFWGSNIIDALVSLGCSDSRDALQLQKKRIIKLLHCKS